MCDGNDLDVRLYDPINEIERKPQQDEPPAAVASHDTSL